MDRFLNRRAALPDESARSMGMLRCHYLDWLRVMAALTVFLLHNLRFFDFMGWHVKNPEQSEWAMQLVLFAVTWTMPLFIFIAGSGAAFALRAYQERAFVSRRFRRLMLPYFLAVAVLIPPQKYLEAVHHGSYGGSFPEFIKVYVPFLLQTDLGWTPIWIGHVAYHAWTLCFLFLFSLGIVPIFRWLWSRPGHNLLVRLVGWSRYPWGMLAFALPAVAINMALKPWMPAYLDWPDFFYLAWFFALGFLFHFEVRLAEAAQKHCRVWLIMALAASVFIHCMALFTQNMIRWMDHPSYSWDYLGFQMIRSLGSFAWTMLLFGLARRFLNRPNRRLAYWNEAVLPFYLLHQTVILAVGYLVVAWDATIPKKFLIIATSSFLIIIAIYEGLIKRFAAPRFLFGMRSKRTHQSSGRPKR